MMSLKKNVFSLFLVLLFVAGCASRKNDLLLGQQEPALKSEWFSTDLERFQLTNRDGELARHKFFDVDPKVTDDNYDINYIIETPRRSPVKFKLDIKSGQHYFDRLYCKEKDPSGKSLSINRPPFHIGIVPRVYDQMGTPQKIYVFSNRSEKTFFNKSYSAKVVGGFVEQVCERGSCTKREDWSLRLVLIGVDNTDKKFRNVASVEDLKKKVRWREALDFFRLGEGFRLLGKDFAVSTKVGTMLSPERVFKYFKENSLVFDEKKRNDLKRSCYILYDHIWDEVGGDSDIEKKMRLTKDINAKAVIAKQMQGNRSKLYPQRFYKAFSTYQSHYSKCEELVYPASINENKERFWFFSFYSLINRLHSDNYYYNCGRRYWRKNSKTRNGRWLYPKKKAFKNCSAASIQDSFQKGIALLSNLRRQNQSSYRFIEYDNSSLGSHAKLYSWIPVSDRRLKCLSRKESYLDQLIFPKDVKLKKRDFNFLNQHKVIF